MGLRVEVQDLGLKGLGGGPFGAPTVGAFVIRVADSLWEIIRCSSCLSLLFSLCVVTVYSQLS